MQRWDSSTFSSPLTMLKIYRGGSTVILWLLQTIRIELQQRAVWQVFSSEKKQEIRYWIENAKMHLNYYF